MTKPTKPSPKAPLRIALIEDHPKARESWCRLINLFPDLSCICTCKSGEEALRVIPQIPEGPPDVVLMDIFLPRMSGIECTARLKVLLPKTQIIILTAMDDEELVFMALEAGADGYLLKRTKAEDLRAALLEVLGGGAPMSSEIARRENSLHLSVREEQILMLIAKGFSNKIIADQLQLSVDTVCHHLKHVFEKMHVTSRTEAAIRYLNLNNPTP
jgi:DNA-binding NarL/FixJ family response regulator